MLRLFVAVEIPPEVKKAIAALCHDVENARWVNPAQMHVTLRFLGDTPEVELPAIRERLARVHMPAFHLGLRGAGVFPEGRGRRPPRVLWLGLEPAAPLLRLKQAVDLALGPEAEAKKAFSPHLTLARFPRPPDRTLGDFLARNRDFCGQAWPVASFSLFASTLLRSGAVHELVADYALLPGHAET